MKAVLMSIRPEWCKKILDGEKTVEIRKSCPAHGTPFKVYIYCTMTGSDKFFTDSLARNVDEWNLWKYPKRLGRVIGEFICDGIRRIGPEYCIVKEDIESAIAGSCLTVPQVKDYAGWKSGLSYADLKDLYGWHISDLKVYDNSKPLSYFSKHGFSSLFGTNVCGNEDCKYYEPSGDRIIPPTCGLNGCSLHRPPQSWCYMEDGE